MKFWGIPGSLQTRPNGTFPDNHRPLRQRAFVCKIAADLRDYREDVGAPDLESAVSVSAGWSVFAMRDDAVYNTYRVYPHSRLITPLFSGCSSCCRTRSESRGRTPGFAHQQPSLGLSADDRFARCDGAEITIELATFRSPALMA